MLYHVCGSVLSPYAGSEKVRTSQTKIFFDFCKKVWGQRYPQGLKNRRHCRGMTWKFKKNFQKNVFFFDFSNKFSNNPILHKSQIKPSATIPCCQNALKKIMPTFFKTISLFFLKISNFILFYFLLEMQMPKIRNLLRVWLHYRHGVCYLEFIALVLDAIHKIGIE